MTAKQQTLGGHVSASGVSLHTGENVTIHLMPGEVGQGILFRRIDIEGKPEVGANVKYVSDLLRNTTLENGDAKVSTVEHVVSALVGLGVDNAVVELDGGEPPIFDGSAKRFVEMIQDVGVVEQDAEKRMLTLDGPVKVEDEGRLLIALPHPTFKVSCTFVDDRGSFTQFEGIEVNPESYANEIANARTFTYYEDIEPLIQAGKIKGGTLDAAIVIKGDNIMAKEPLRFSNEFVRHKILDIVGDIALLGCPLNAHIIAIRSGHSINSKLTLELSKLLK